jgi:hypothetical protein
MGSQTEWWWPDQRSFWPLEPRVMSLDGFIRAFKAMGFESCAGPESEDTYAKIALYLLNGRPTHAARIESNVLWTSKLGRAELIEHAPTGLNGTTYGRPLHFFRKKTQDRL